MKQQKLNIEIDFSQPLVHWAEYYDSNIAVRSIWTRGSFLQLIKTNRDFFGDAVANLRSGTFLTMSFPGRLNEWLSIKKPNNLHKSVQGGMQ
jgi:hypothetical protein